MKTLPISNINFESRGHFNGKAAKVIVPFATLAAVSDMYVRRKPEEPINEFIDDIKDSSDQLVLDDEFSFENYYHIDLNMANSRTFRDSELFNPLLDDEQESGYIGYDNNDVRSLKNNRALSNDFYAYSLCENDLGGTELPELVKKPWNIEKEDEIFISVKDAELIKSSAARKMLKALSPLKIVADNLKKLVIALLSNANLKGSRAAQAEIDPDVDNIMYMVNNKDENISMLSYTIVVDLLKKNMTNTQINNYINAYIENYKRGSYGLMKYFDTEKNEYNKRKILKDKRFDLLEFIK